MNRLHQLGGILSSNRMTTSPSINHTADTFKERATSANRRRREVSSKPIAGAALRQAARLATPKKVSSKRPRSAVRPQSKITGTMPAHTGGAYA